MNKYIAKLIFQRFQEKNPEPTTELMYQTPFELLIAVILSAQATDKSVNLATQLLFKVANTPEKILNLGLEQLKNFIKSIGCYNNKAKNILKTCNAIITQFNGEVPKTRSELESLPGVGRKTANVILNTLYGMLTLAVDTHVYRVSKRIGLAKGTTPLQVEHELLAIIDKKFLQHAHHWLILHGRYTCKARKPKCSQCLIEDLCEFPYKVYQ